MLHGRGPREDVGILIVIFQILLDSGDQLWRVPKDAATDALVGDFAKPPLYHVHPRTRSRDEAQMEPRMSPEPRFHARVLMGRVIVRNEMQVEFGRGLDVDLVEEADELLMPMARHAFADHLAVEHVEGRKQCGRTIAFVVVCHGLATALLQRKAGLGAIEGLDLTFLVDTQNKGFVRWIEIESNDIVELLDKVFVATELEGLDEMGLEVVLFPDALNGHPTDFLCLGHATHAPMGSIGRLRVQCGIDDCANFLFWNVWNATRTRSVLFQTFQPQSQKTFPPELYRRSGNFQCSRDVLAEHAIGRHLDNLSTLHQSRWETAAMSPRGQGRALFGRQKDRGCGSHAPKIGYIADISQVINGTLH